MGVVEGWGFIRVCGDITKAASTKGEPYYSVGECISGRGIEWNRPISDTLF